MKCKFIKPDRTECNANAMTGSDYCFTHNPDISSEVKRKVRSRGGQGNKVKIKQALSPVDIRQPKDVVSLLEDTINRVRSGELDIKVANCVGYLAGHLIKALEVAELAGRVEMVEKVILEKRKSYRGD